MTPLTYLRDADVPRRAPAPAGVPLYPHQPGLQGAALVLAAPVAEAELAGEAVAEREDLAGGREDERVPGAARDAGGQKVGVGVRAVGVVVVVVGCLCCCWCCWRRRRCMLCCV